jgi:hypothetical protein
MTPESFKRLITVKANTDCLMYSRYIVTIPSYLLDERIGVELKMIWSAPEDKDGTH